MIIKNVKVFQEDGSFREGDVVIENGFFATETKDDTVVDGEGCYAIPGLTDIHFHGCVNYDFCDGTKEAIEAIAAYEAGCGVTSIAPATMTLSEEALAGICEAASSYGRGKGAYLCGINMEGPFISLEKKGAQNPKYIHKPDADMFRRLQKKADGLIKLVDIAPETEGAMEFISDVKDEVVISLAHTAAGYETAKEAFEKGASHVTHLYNAMLPLSHREPGVIGAAFDAPDCHVELICDGIHIMPPVVRATFQLFGDDRVILISDSMMAAGMEDGEYALGGQKVLKKGSKATLEDGTIAGSVTNLMDCMRTAVKMGIPLGSAVKCAAVNPAKEIGIYDKFGSIAEGKHANLVLLREDLSTHSVYLDGVKLP